MARLRELAHIAGIVETASLQGLAGDPATLDLTASGPAPRPRRRPWRTMPEKKQPRAQRPRTPPGSVTDELGGTITLHNANWKSETLAGHVQISQAVFGISMPTSCFGPHRLLAMAGEGNCQPAPALIPPSPLQECPPQLDLRFGELDAAVLQAALLGSASTRYRAFDAHLPHQPILASRLAASCRHRDSQCAPPRPVPHFGMRISR